MSVTLKKNVMVMTGRKSVAAHLEQRAGSPSVSVKATKKRLNGGRWSRVLSRWRHMARMMYGAMILKILFMTFRERASKIGVDTY